MATIDIRKVHGTTEDEAATRLGKLLDRFIEERGDLVKDVAWNGDGREATVTGKGFKGRCIVGPSDVTVAIDLSFIARAFKGRIHDEMTRRLDATFPS